MKLTQKTLFQCFDKSKKDSTIILDETVDEIIECQRADFLLPIHIRQDDCSSDTSSTNHQWQMLESNEEIPSNYLSNFSQLCSLNDNQPNEINSISNIQFLPVKSKEHQMDLFQQYTTDDLSSYTQSIIDWKAMFQHLQDYRTKAIEQNQYEQLPWTEIYRPRHSKAYLGSHTKSIRRFNEWFLYWKKKLTNEQTSKPTRKGRKRVRNDDDEDFLADSNLIYYNRCQTKQEYPQIIYIHGLGTTSLVHALAEEHHFKITEINGSQCRARSSLIKQLEQVTSHHYLSLKRCASVSRDEKSNGNTSVPVRKKAKNERGTIMSFFNNKKQDSTDRSKTRRRSISTKKSKVSEQPKAVSSSSVQVEKTSLILFDEIDTLTIDDNFWSCLKKLLETAKKPIVLTSNSRSNPDDAIFHLSKIGDYEMIHLESNPPESICCFLRLILLVEMLEIPSQNDLIDLFQSCACDLRRTLLTLQFLGESSSNSTRSVTKILSNNQPKFPSSNVFDTMFYSNLHEQWDESILKPLFDDLTKKYTSEYEQCNSQLMKTISNNSQRIELYDTLKTFLQESTTNRSALNLDYRPFIRQICQSEQIRASESHSTRRIRHCLSFRGCPLEWSDFSILSHGLD